MTALRALVLAVAVALSGLVAGLWSASAPRAWACSCVDLSDPVEGTENLDFIGKVTVTHAGEPDEEGLASYIAEVQREWKGEGLQQITFSTNTQTVACGLGIAEEGQTFNLVGIGSGGSYSSNWCLLGYFRDVDLEESATEILGEPTPFAELEPNQIDPPGEDSGEDPVGEPGAGLPPWGVAVGTLGAAALAAGLWFVLRLIAARRR